MSKLPLFDPAGWTLDALRRVLYLATRTRVFPETAGMLQLRPDVPVCYVLDDLRVPHLAQLP